jgi:uncharacterized membrane protein
MENTSNNSTGKNSGKRNYIAGGLIPALGLAGMGISGYLTYIHYKSQSSICFFNTNCDAVLTSSYSRMWGIPLSLLGFLMYAAIALLGFISLWDRKGWIRWTDMGIYGLALSSLIFTVYLYYLEIFEIHAFCTWCIGSSIVVLCIFVLSLLNLARAGFDFKGLPHFIRTRMKSYIQW